MIKVANGIFVKESGTFSQRLLSLSPESLNRISPALSREKTFIYPFASLGNWGKNAGPKTMVTGDKALARRAHELPIAQDPLLEKHKKLIQRIANGKGARALTAGGYW